MSELSAALAAKVDRFLREHGAEALERALDSGHLFTDSLRDGSKLALVHSAEYVEAGVPCALIVTLHPRNKKVGERASIRLLTGESKAITVELPAEGDGTSG